MLAVGGNIRKSLCKLLKQKRSPTAKTYHVSSQESFLSRYDKRVTLSDKELNTFCILRSLS